MLHVYEEGDARIPPGSQVGCELGKVWEPLIYVFLENNYYYYYKMKYSG